MTETKPPQDDCYDCRNAGEELDAFVRGELPIEAAGRMQEHLHRCRHCDDVARFEQAFRDRLKRAGTKVECPEALRRKVQDLLARARDDA